MTPVVTTNHSPFTDDTRRYYRALQGRIPIVAISHHQASTAGDVPVARVIHHGIDTDRYPVGPGGDYLVFDGRMSPVKGVRQAGRDRVGSRRATRHRRQDARDRRARVLRRRGQTTSQPRHLLRGRVARDASSRWSAARWRCSTHPLDEPFGLSMVEALACGTPVITTPRGAAPEIVDNGTTGFLTSTTDEAVAAVAWAAKLDRHAGRAAVEARFTARRMVADPIAPITTRSRLRSAA